MSVIYKKKSAYIYHMFKPMDFVWLYGFFISCNLLLNKLSLNESTIVSHDKYFDYYQLSLKNLPAKALSMPVRTIHPMLLSASNSFRTCPTSVIKPSHKAFRAFLLFNWIKPTFFFSPFTSLIIYSNCCPEIKNEIDVRYKYHQKDLNRHASWITTEEVYD